MQEQPLSDYRKMERISYTGLKELARSPAHYWEWFHEPEDKPTPAMLLGSLVHCLVLEPLKYPKRYAIGLEHGRKTNAEKEAWAAFEAENTGKHIITPEMLELATKLKYKVTDHPAARLLLSEGEAEKTVLWTDAATGAKCKSRIDFVNTEFGALVDLKTCADASYHEFSRAAFNNSYHVQASFYLDGYNAAHGTNYTDFVFICIEKTPPYEVACWQLDEESIALGRAFYQPLLEKYVQCLESGYWHGYEREIKPLSLPLWAFK